MARGSENPRPVLTSTPRTGLGPILDYHKIGYFMILTLVVAIILFVIIFLLWLSLWETKKDLKDSREYEKFWFNKWADEAHANLELHKLYDGSLVEVAHYRYALEESEENYKALAQGRDEESEAYEMQFLSFSETLEAQAKAIESLNWSLQMHDGSCLPIFAEGELVITDPFEETPVYATMLMNPPE